jgi:hypothetical protein
VLALVESHLSMGGRGKNHQMYIVGARPELQRHVLPRTLPDPWNAVADTVATGTRLRYVQNSLHEG